MTTENKSGRRCIGCGIVKALDCFYIKRESGRPYSRCKECHKLLTYAWKERHPEKAKAINVAAQARRRDKNQDYHRGRYWADPERARERMRAYCATDEGKQARAEKAKLERARLSDHYLRQTLRASEPHISASDIPQRVVELKREQLRLHRLAKEMQQQVANQTKEST
jgi:hypothetical protein